MSRLVDWEGCSEEQAVRIGDALVTSLVAIPRPSDGLERLLGAVANPWVRFLDAFGELVDLPAAAARAILDRAEVGRGWEPAPVPGLELVHFEGGPRTAGADVGLVRLAPGALHPAHEHLGEESIVVLAGGYVDSAGYTVAAGHVERRHAGEPHSFVAGPEGVVFAVVLRQGVAFLGPNGEHALVLRAGGA
ncbi:hypothetical protein LBMAG42_21110 [Deltaproteobacteria bacterium]|nr:hypothetical protein LBMAG42_21110 [Deltaproteobacteria bacterium]